MRTAALTLTFLALLGCDEEPTETLDRPPDEAPEEPPERETPLVELHEWGLISERLGGTRSAVTRAPRPTLDELLGDVEGVGLGETFGSGGLGLTGIGRGGGRPVLYAHLADGVEEHTFDVRVDVVGGNGVEHWPLVGGEVGMRASIPWVGVRAHRGGCGARSYPAVGDEACETEDDFCEAALGAENETIDGACLEYRGASYDHLFYRAAMSQAPLPLEVTAGDALTVRHRGEHPIPGQLLRVRGGSETHVVVLDPPAPGASVTVPEPGHRGRLRSTLAEGLAGLGLTPPERDAFLAAWENQLVRGAATHPMPPSLEPPTDALLYWMPEEDLAAHLRIHASERVAVRRAILVRVGVAYSGSDE